MHLEKDTCFQWELKQEGRESLSLVSVGKVASGDRRFGATVIMSTCDHQCPASTAFRSRKFANTESASNEDQNIRMRAHTHTHTPLCVCAWKVPQRTRRNCLMELLENSTVQQKQKIAPSIVSLSLSHVTFIYCVHNIYLLCPLSPSSTTTTTVFILQQAVCIF